jgi:hypothetical protein
MPALTSITATKSTIMQTSLRLQTTPMKRRQHWSAAAASLARRQSSASEALYSLIGI